MTMRESGYLVYDRMTWIVRGDGSDKQPARKRQREVSEIHVDLLPSKLSGWVTVSIAMTD